MEIFFFLTVSSCFSQAYIAEVRVPYYGIRSLWSIGSFKRRAWVSVWVTPFDSCHMSNNRFEIQNSDPQIMQGVKLTLSWQPGPWFHIFHHKSAGLSQTTQFVHHLSIVNTALFIFSCYLVVLRLDWSLRYAKSQSSVKWRPLSWCNIRKSFNL